MFRQYRSGVAPAVLLVACVVATAAGCHRSATPSNPANLTKPVTIAAPKPGLKPVAAPAWKPTAALFVNAPHDRKEVALTFDAGSTADAVPLILKTLAEHHVHATFFLTGKFCKKFGPECRAIADAGMELGNHSYDHPPFTHKSDSAICTELAMAEAQIVSTCGRGAKPLFRFPYGDSDRRTQALVAKQGYQAIHWTVDSLDAFGKPKTADFVVQRIVKRIHPGDITLMHVACVTSAQALPRIFDHLDKMGVTVVPVSELLTTEASHKRIAKNTHH